MSSGSHPVGLSTGFKVEPHLYGFAEDEACVICEGEDVAEASPALCEGEMQNPNGGDNWQVCVIVSGSTRELLDGELVHLSCHPNQPYHYKCLKQWMQRDRSCPLDRREIDPAVPSKGISYVADERARTVAERVSQVATAVFSGVKRVCRFLFWS
jgi:hypothetical protein